MRLIKKIKFNKANEFTQFKKVEQIFNKIKLNIDEDCVLKHVKDISRLNFYIVIEYINLIDEKINYIDIFPEENIVDFNALVKEQEKFKKYVSEKNKKEPQFFKKLGMLSEVMGCFLIATTKKNLRSVQHIDFSKKEHSIALKLPILDLPKEFELLCNEFSKTKDKDLTYDYIEFQKFINMDIVEQDNIINETLYNMQLPAVSFNHNTTNIFTNPQSSATTIQNAAERNINRIYDIPFLNGMLESALSNENYELCVKIRDRVDLIQNSNIPN